MNLYQQVKADLLEARKTKNELVKSVLSVLLAEADKDLIVRKPENEQHKLMFDLVLKTEKQHRKALSQFSGSKSFTEQLEKELAVISKYLPKTLTQDEIKAILEREKFENLGLVMKYFAANYKGQYQPNELKSLYEGA